MLKCAKHNAEVYGVASKIYFILGDCFKILKTRLKGLAGGENKVVVFGSPPWGGEFPSTSLLFYQNALLAACHLPVPTSDAPVQNIPYIVTKTKKKRQYC